MNGARGLFLRLRAVDPIVVGFFAIAVLSLAIRISLIKQSNPDVVEYERWLHFIRHHGGFEALKFEFSNYTPFYSYLLLLGAHLQHGFSDVFVIKYSSIIADFVVAAFAFKIVRLKYQRGYVPLFASSTVLLAPTVITNSSWWGQTDMLWVAPLVASTYYFLTKRGLAALVAFGVAFAIKPQAFFLLPLLVLLALKRELLWRYFVAIPVVYVVSVIPAWIAGRSFWNLITIYARQERLFPALNHGAPNVFGWVPERDVGRAAWMWGLAMVLLLLFFAATIRFQTTPALLLALSTASVVYVPFVLPKMHDRYFFAADVFSILLAIYVPRLFPVAMIVQLTSFFSYWPFLFMGTAFSTRVLSLFELTAIAMLLVWIAREIRHQELRSTSS